MALIKFNNKINAQQEYVLDTLFKIDSNMIIAGSYALSEYGLLGRTAIDLDIIVFNNEIRSFLETNGEFTKNSSFIVDHPFITFIESYLYENIKIDVIGRSDVIPSVSLNGLPYKFASIQNIIESKQFLINNNKHKLDIDYIFKMLLKKV